MCTHTSPHHPPPPPQDHAETNQSSKDFFEFSKCDLSQVHPEINEDDYDDNADVGKTTAIAGYDIHKKDDQGRDMVWTRLSNNAATTATTTPPLSSTATGDGG